MTRAEKILQRVTESPQNTVELTKDISGFDFKNRKKKIKIPKGSYIFIEFDEFNPQQGIVSNIVSNNLYFVSMLDWKRYTK